MCSISQSAGEAAVEPRMKRPFGRMKSALRHDHDMGALPPQNPSCPRSRRYPTSSASLQSAGKTAVEPRMKRPFGRMKSALRHDHDMGALPPQNPSCPRSRHCPISSASLQSAGGVAETAGTRSREFRYEVGNARRHRHCPAWFHHASISQLAYEHSHCFQSCH